MLVTINQVVLPAALVATTQISAEARTFEGSDFPDDWAYNKFITRGVMRFLKDEPPSVRMSFTAHLLVMAWKESHHASLEEIAPKYGLRRETMGKATKRLVELGLLEKRERGRIEAHRTRPAEYRITELVKQFADRSTTGVTPAHTDNPKVTEQAGGVTSQHTSTGVTSHHTLKKKDLTTTNTQASKNKPLNKGGCEECGGAVMTNPQGLPNPLCRDCYFKQKNKAFEEKKQSEPPEQYGLHLIDLGRVEFVDLPDGTVERKVLWGPGSET